MDTGRLPVEDSGGVDFFRSLGCITGLLIVGLFGAILNFRFPSGITEGLFGVELILRLDSSGCGGLAGTPDTGCTGRLTTSFFKLK